MDGCLTELEIFQIYRDELSDNEARKALRHVLSCELCYDQWKRYLIDEKVATSIRSAVAGNIEGADESPGLSEAIELPEKLCIPGFNLRGDFIESGQSRVYRAIHEASGEEVAIKVFYNSPLNEGGNLRFSREIRSLARLRHPHVIPIRSEGEVFGHAYFVTPWIDGLPLHEYVKQKRISLNARLKILENVCSAVSHAHKRGVMHLDLKPSNVLMDSTGEPVVLDFGLARLIEGGPVDSISSLAGIAGTPAYMAPEQATDRGSVDTRTDVFMLGILMYEVLALQRARPPNGSGTGTNDLDQALLAPKPIRQVAPRIGSELAAIVTKATALNHLERYQSVEALLQDLQALKRGTPVTAMSDSWIYRLRKFSTRNLAFIGGAISVALILLFSVEISRTTQQMVEETYGRATQVTQRVVRERERILDRRLSVVCQELADVYSKLGNGEKARAYEGQAQAARFRAELGADSGNDH
jgi:serine/threonine protein kinase